ncbi:MAG: LysM peptidoglycan-binding domain-containing protein, partial [Magnetovibrio sp.]|nr:LysM peptidoglycan-binding domain-containing protein [Magnetovibrio sp.]
MPSLKQQQARDWAYSRVSGLEDPRPDLYNDGSNVPTIGVGYALVVKGRNGWSVKEELVADFRSIGAPLSAASIKTLNGIADAKNKGQQAIAKSLINDLSHVSIEKEQIQPLYNRSFDRHYMRTGQILENKNFDQLPAEQQGVLTIVTFQSPRALKNEKGAIISGIQNKDPAQVVGAFKRIGKMFKEPGRYNGLAHNFLDPDQKYTIDVRQGDYLGKIAQRYNTTVDALMNVNTHIENKDEIRAGDVLVLPAGAKKNGHFVYDAQSAYKVLGVNHTLEGGNYIGPSHELSPQDAMTADQSKAWVEKMQAVRNAKKSNLLSEAISSNPFKQTASTTFGNDSLQVASLGNDAFVSMPSNTASPKTVDVRYGDTLSGLAVQHGTTVDAFMRANPQIKDADKIQAGARLNRPSKNVSVANVQTAIQGFMNTPVYRDQRQPAAFETVQNAFASLNQRQNQEKAQRAAAMKQAEKQKADDEKVRQGAYQRIEVNRQATIAAQQKGDRALDAGRAKEEQAKEKQQAKQLAREEQGMPELDGVHEIGVAKIDQLGENAISKAMPKDDLGQRRGLSPENIAAAVRKRNALAPNQ